MVITREVVSAGEKADSSSWEGTQKGREKAWKTTENVLCTFIKRTVCTV
jgi:hypothetical protein